MPSSPQSVADVLADLQRVFARLELRWFVFGAQAAILHGVARLSADVDVTVELGERQRDLVDSALGHTVTRDATPREPTHER